MRRRAKLRADRRSSRCREMAVFRFFRMAAVRHFGFLKARNFNCQCGSKDQYASPCQIWRRSVESLPRYGCIYSFQDGGCPPSWICHRPVWTTHKEHLVVFVTVQNLV